MKINNLVTDSHYYKSMGKEIFGKRLNYNAIEDLPEVEASMNIVY